MKKCLFTTCLALSSWIAYCQNTPQNLGTNVNTTSAELRPTISPDGKRMYYLMEKDVTQTKKRGEKTAQAVCFTEKDEQGNWKPFSAAPKPFNDQRDNAIFWVSADGNTAYMRGAYSDGKPTGRGISKTSKTENGWSVPTTIQLEGYAQMSVDRYTGASMTIDGKHMLLYFSEEKNSQLNDIYYSRNLGNDVWSKPAKILGNISLEDYDEIAPFIAADHKTMYFSSNRPGGSGDYDIWMSKRLDDQWLQWSDPVNLGKNINSEQWDAYFSMDAEGEIGFWATTKNAQGKSDLVTSKLEAWQQAPNKVDLIASILKSDDAELKLNGKISIQVEGDDVIDSVDIVEGEAKKSFSFGKKYIISTQIEGHVSKTDTIDLTEYGLAKEMRKSYIVHPEKPKQLTDAEGNWIDEKGRILPSNSEDSLLIQMYRDGNIEELFNKEGILFDFGKSTLREESVIMLNKIARLLVLVPEIEIDLSAHTDHIGSVKANQTLSENRAESVKNYLISKKVNNTQIEAHGYGELKPVASNSTEVGRQQNRRVEFKVLKK
jgi:outer membrane protein OmpA-like peptidoglycan-associated protein